MRKQVAGALRRLADRLDPASDPWERSTAGMRVASGPIACGGGGGMGPRNGDTGGMEVIKLGRGGGGWTPAPESTVETVTVSGLGGSYCPEWDRRSQQDQ